MSSKICYRYRRPCIWGKSFKVEFFLKKLQRIFHEILLGQVFLTVILIHNTVWFIRYSYRVCIKWSFDITGRLSTLVSGFEWNFGSCQTYLDHTILLNWIKQKVYNKLYNKNFLTSVPMNCEWKNNFDAVLWFQINNHLC